jgi:hypothetical protein
LIAELKAREMMSSTIPLPTCSVILIFGTVTAIFDQNMAI